MQRKEKEDGRKLVGRALARYEFRVNILVMVLELVYVV